MIIILLLLITFFTTQSCEMTKKARIGTPVNPATGAHLQEISREGHAYFKTPQALKMILRQSVPLTQTSLMSNHEQIPAMPRPNQLRNLMRDGGERTRQEMFRNRYLASSPAPIDDSNDESSEADDQGCEWQVSSSRALSIKNSIDLDRWNNKPAHLQQGRKRLAGSLQYVNDDGTING